MASFPSRILATIDPASPDDLVLRTATSIARVHKIDVSALAVLPPPLQIQRGLATLEVDFEQDLTEVVTAALKEQCVEFRLPEASAHVLRGHLQKTIGSFVTKHQIDLVFVGLHDRDIGDYFLGTTATGVLRHADSDIYGCRRELADNSFLNVIIAIELDDGVLARALLAKAANFLRPYPTARIHVRHVIRSSLLVWQDEPDDYSSSVDWQEINSHLVRSKEQELNKLVDNESIVVESVKVLSGQPSRLIKEEIETLSADLVIMGTGQHFGIGWHIGSTTNNVMHGVDCDVLAVRPQ